MSISGLSNHLCVVVATIISLVVASSTFHQARASPDSHDFTNSRQYKRNLAVSKFRDHPHWLSNYTWKPPEKFYGPRKRPSWEVDEVPETKAEQKERKEREEWENKMREVSRRERAKWKMYEVNERSKPQSSEQVFMPLDDDGQQQSSTENHKNEFPQSKDSSIFNLSIMKPTAQGFLKNTPKSSKIPTSMSRIDEQTTLPTTFSNGRWGMSGQEALKNLLNEMTGESPNLESSDIPLKQDPTPVANEEKETTGTEEATRLRKSFSNGRWGMNVAEPAKREFFTKPLKSSRKKSKDQSTVARTNVSEAPILPSRLGRETTIPGSFPINRWGMNVKEVPKEFLKEMSRSSKNSESSKSTQKQNEHQMPVENAKMEATTKRPNIFSNGRWGMNVEKPTKPTFVKDTSTLLRKQTKDHSTVSRSSILGPSIHSSRWGEETATPTIIPSGRWGMSVKAVPKEFLKEMSRGFQPLGNSGRVLKARTPAGNIKIHAGQNDGGKAEKVFTGKAATKLSNDFPSGRWGMDVDSPPGDFLREISRRELTKIPEGYGLGTVHQRADSTARNNPASRESTFSIIPRISNGKIFLQPFLSVIEVSMTPKFLVSLRMQRTLPNYNVPIIPVCPK